MPKPTLKTLKPENGGGAWNSAENALEVYTPHALNQAAGYLKYALGGSVYYRGQTKLYTPTRASLFRGIKSWAKVHKRQEEFNIFLKKCRSERVFVKNTPDYAYEPLLQHYGIRTPWLDLVDNIWVALWFACHEAQSSGALGEYCHYIQRKAGYAYIVLMHVGTETPDPKKSGLWTTPEAEIIDLRKAAPSLYLRPHAQHGLLFRRKTYASYADIDLDSFVEGVICVKVETGLAWLGGGHLTSTHHFFPPPVYDFGYDRLLANAPNGNVLIGAIQHIGA